jgi:ankyrin repeat protein
MALEKLFRAAKENDVGLLQEAIKAGDDVNVRDDEGKTALILAVEKNCAEIVKALVARKKDVVDDSGKIIQPKIDLNAKDSDGNTALMLAAKKGHLEVVQELMKAGADVTVKCRFGETALMMAAMAG